MRPDDFCITAIIPTYHRAALLHRAVRSVLAQTHRNLRVIVCDNASEDRTPEVMAKLQREDPRVEYHRHERNHGAIHNFRFAMDRVETDWFSILSDDDVLLPGFYARAARTLSASPAAGAGFYAGQCYTLSELTGRARVRPRRLWADGPHPAGRHAPDMLREHFTWTSCVFSRDMARRLGPLDGVLMIDILYLLRACAAFPFVVDLHPGAIFVENGTNNSAHAGMGGVRANFAAGEAALDRFDPATVDVPQTRRALVELFASVGNAALRHASTRGDAALAGEAEEFLRAIGAASPRREAQAAMVRRGGVGGVLLRAAMTARARYRALRQSLRRRDTVASVLARHADARSVAWITQDPGLPPLPAIAANPGDPVAAGPASTPDPDSAARHEANRRLL